MTSYWRHVPTRFLLSQCRIITFLILKSDQIENSRIELKGIVLPVPSNQIKVSFIIILPFSLVHLWFFSKRKMWVDYWGRWAKGMLAPLSNYCPAPPPSSWTKVVGHILRSFGLTKTILQDTVQGKRRNGRLKKRWEDYGVDRDGLC